MCLFLVVLQLGLGSKIVALKIPIMLTSFFSYISLHMTYKNGIYAKQVDPGVMNHTKIPL